MLLEELIAAIAAPVQVEEFDLGPLGPRQVNVKWDGLRTAKFVDAAIHLNQNPDPCNSPVFESMRLHALTTAVGLLDIAEFHKLTAASLLAAGDKLANICPRMVLNEISTRIDSLNKIYQTSTKDAEKN